METIVLEVDEGSAKAWNNSSPSVRAAYESKIIAVLKELQEAEAADQEGFTKEQLDFLKKEAAENTERYEWWNDEEMVAELEQIAADMESGKDPGISWDDLKKDLLSRHRKDAI
jgi:hypothetical protein